MYTTNGTYSFQMTVSCPGQTGIEIGIGFIFAKDEPGIGRIGIPIYPGQEAVI